MARCSGVNIRLYIRSNYFLLQNKQNQQQNKLVSMVKGNDIVNIIIVHIYGAIL